ncbi:ATP-dependent DNA helicase [Acidiferrimicrobium sp. IK]|uniref:ATP-dependent DNA helicase n=1 Tax=Acidiferrimicrobium sp. IK TaxID=2871700 RepID=UPI0029169500|nr:ATP-dependent DNA helicase [Acidiferrimicrobium sp. IK]MCU4183928.1 ATP-dependent DNA helicase [Acidiferrimicrobium sp. IK]
MTEVAGGPATDPTIDAALRRVTGALSAREDRPAQRVMAAAVAKAVTSQRHLIVQAGTGTGKSLGYLVPALVLGARVVVSTATKALQDQLATRDLPLLEEHLGVPFTWAVLKGRSNYLCRQRASEIGGAGDQLPLGAGTSEEAAAPEPDVQLTIDGTSPPAPLKAKGDRAGPARGLAGAATPTLAGGFDAGLGPLGREIRRLIEWGERAQTGDRADLPWEPSVHAWAQVSVGVRDCPGAAKCPSGDVCFAEAARDKASQADVIVVNTHLYATHLAAGGGVLPAHDVVVFDEAHELEDIASASLGFELTSGRLVALARTARPLVADAGAATAVEDAAAILADALSSSVGRRLPQPLPADLAERLTLVRERVAALGAAVRKGGQAQGASQAPGAGQTQGAGQAPGAGQAQGSGRQAGDDAPRRQRAQQAGLGLVGDIDQVLALAAGKVAWVEGPAHAPVLRVAPIDVGATLQALLWQDHAAPTAVCTSATIPPRLGERIGLAPGSYDELDVGSPFDYPSQSLLYCAMHLPDPRQAAYEQAMLDELVALIEAAGGRTLALFTSWRAMQAAAQDIRERIPWTVLTQADLPKTALVEAFAADEQSCLFATMGFWQGVDVPGPALSLVVMDKLPFPRPDDPLLQARRDRLGRAAFSTIDVPRAATLLAQGAGRLIRAADDRGVVAVLDQRLGTARYKWDLVRALPPMRRTRSLADVVDFLAPVRARAVAT